MLREDKTEVLVVGAGPVGMVTALLLAESGVEVKIIDQETRTAAHSQACALHPRTLKLFDRLGLFKDILTLGRRIESVAFYDRGSRRAEIKLAKLPVEFPFLVVLPQGDLEDLLERRLKKEAKIEVGWNHRLSDLKLNGVTVQAGIDRLGDSSKGYGVSEWDSTVEATSQTRASFVVGADGHNSHVRQRLGIDYERFADPELFVVYEFESTAELGNEMRVVFDHTSTNALWPLSGNTCRWSFQWLPKEAGSDFPSKDRSRIVVAAPEVDQRTREHLQKLLSERAPWFQGTVDALDWAVDVQFEQRLARQFGQGRCWLAGDAAHQTGPVGMQSMNVGLCEAEFLANVLKKILRENASPDLLEAYSHERRHEWQHLLGLKGGLKTRPETDDWVKSRAAKILPCIPASGEDLTHLANQIGLDF